MTKPQFEVGQQVWNKWDGFGVIVKRRKIDIDWNPGTHKPTDGYFYTVKPSKAPLGGPVFRTPSYYSDELKEIWYSFDGREW